MGTSRNRLVVAAIACFAAACLSLVHGAAPVRAAFAGPVRSAVPQLQHIIIIVQENRSFDSYFGTYPGANGIPMSHGRPLICDPDPDNGNCIKPFHDKSDINSAGPHDSAAFNVDEDGGKMDGFVTAADFYHDPAAVMGYHDQHEVPNYWAYAQEYVLQDELFAPSDSYSGPEHNYLVSNWSAVCSVPNDPSSCVDSFLQAGLGRGDLAWTDITWLLHAEGVSWKYYVFGTTSPDVVDPAHDDGADAVYESQRPDQATVWNPLPAFSDVVQDHQLKNIVGGKTFYADAKAGTLPAVCWVVPDLYYSEHPPERISRGMQYVSGLVNAVMSGPDWSTSAIFITWDEWGGLSDHVLPPSVDWGGYGARVPGLLISPWAERGVVDHQVLSFDAYDKLIEDLFLNGQRLDPKTDNRPDPRPDVRENFPGLGDLLSEFDFNQVPRPPMVLRNAHEELGP
jgi:phospholipase C